MSDNIAIEMSDYYRDYRYKVVLVDMSKTFNYPKGIRTQWWNGYVELKKNDHREDDYNNYPYQVHGGITYQDGSFIGFDTAHSSDTLEECDRKYVTNECKNLIDQIIRHKTQYKAI